MRLRPWRKPALRPEPLARAAVVGDLVRATLERDGECTFRATGRSMLGAIADGELVRLVPPATIRRGDVVMAALPDDRLVIHRVAEISHGDARLRGDSCWRADPPVPIDAVIAVVERARRPTLRSLPYRLVPT